MNQVVTFVDTAVDGKKGTNKFGPFWFRVFKTAGGDRYQTFDVDLGDKIAASFGTPVEVTYEVEENGKYQNNVLKGIREETASANLQALLEQNPPQDSRELRIMRQSGLDRAINTVKAGIVEVDGVADLFRLSDAYIDYFENGVPAQEEAEVY